LGCSLLASLTAAHVLDLDASLSQVLVRSVHVETDEA